MDKFRLFLSLILMFGCKVDTEHKEKIDSLKPTETVTQADHKKEEIQTLEFNEFDRSASFERIKNKIQNQESLVIHIRVPLCDNENQGIVPVSAQLGNGFDLNNNLYWGAKYGVRNYFKRYSDWEHIESIQNINAAILERVIFKKVFENGANVYLIADAYQGDQMKICLMDLINSIAGRKKNFIEIGNEKIGIDGNADLLVFNGHNGLMDDEIESIESKDQRIRETAVIGCISHNYFENHLLRAKGYPLLMTTNLMAPEAYVLESLVNAWSNLKNEQEIRQEAGKAYHQFQKCGLKGATKLFRFGW